MLDVKKALIPALAATAFLTACGDAETTDSRQWYTKAPLEDPGLTITPEVPSEMSELGEPDLLGTGAGVVEDAGAASANGTTPAGDTAGPPATSDSVGD